MCGNFIGEIIQSVQNSEVLKEIESAAGKAKDVVVETAGTVGGEIVEKGGKVFEKAKEVPGALYEAAKKDPLKAVTTAASLATAGVGMAKASAASKSREKQLGEMKKRRRQEARAREGVRRDTSQRFGRESTILGGRGAGTLGGATTRPGPSILGRS